MKKCLAVQADAAQLRIEEQCPPLPLQTFRLASVDTPTQRDMIDACGIGVVARSIGAEALQTARLFCWATGATEPSEITDASIGLIKELLSRLSTRFGTHPAHFESSVDDAIDEAKAKGAPARDRTTIARHINRLKTLSSHGHPLFEQRIGPSYRLDPDPNEIDVIEGWSHWAFVVVERDGVIRKGKPLEKFGTVESSSALTAMWGRELFKEASRIAGCLHETGRVCVLSRHEKCLRIIPGFWALRDL